MSGGHVCLCALSSMFKLRACCLNRGPSDLKGQILGLICEGIQDFIACQERQPPLASFNPWDHSFIATDRSSSLLFRVCT
eukprot:scaffold196217_cov13-Tisochrysis_lutea.AAC.1